MPKYLDGAGLLRFWNNIKGSIGSASQEQVDAWLDEHPEATTTVQDGAITTAKLADGAVTDAKLAQEVKSALDTYCGLNFGESLEIVANEYVDGSGRIASDSHFSRTRAFKVFKNVPLTVKATLKSMW